MIIISYGYNYWKDPRYIRICTICKPLQSLLEKTELLDPLLSETFLVNKAEMQWNKQKQEQEQQQQQKQWNQSS